MKRSPMPRRETPLRRRKGLSRGAPPAPGAALARRSPLPRETWKHRRAREAAQPVIDAVFARDSGCVLRHTSIAGDCGGKPCTPHHLEKQSRRRGGWTHRNLVTLCAVHNGWVEDNPQAAWRLGLVVNDRQCHLEAWAAMRTHCLAVGRLVEPCPGAEQAPDTRPEAGRYVCMGCGHSYELAAALDGGPGGTLPPHTRELGW